MIKKIGQVLVGATAALTFTAGITTQMPPANAQSTVYAKVIPPIGVLLRDTIGGPTRPGPRGGEVVNLICESTGPSINGNIVWDKINSSKGVGFAPNAYLLTGYDGFTPGVPRCDAAPTGVSASADAAARWAEARVGAVNGPENYNCPNCPWSGWCETFVELAYRSGAGYSTARMPLYANADAHLAAARPRLQGGVPPRGAVVLYSPNHVAISVGGGRVVSTIGYSGQAYANQNVAYNGVQGVTYQGWYLP
jgi:hypothetical protein